MTGNENEPLWTADQVATFLNIAEKTVRNRVYAEGADQIPHIRVGGALRFRPADIRRWVDEQNQPAEGAA